MSAGLIAVGVFVGLCALAVVVRLLHRRRDAGRSAETKQGPPAEEPPPEFPFNGQAESENDSFESPKEFFI